MVGIWNRADAFGEFQSLIRSVERALEATGQKIESAVNRIRGGDSRTATLEIGQQSRQSRITRIRLEQNLTFADQGRRVHVTAHVRKREHLVNERRVDPLRPRCPKRPVEQDREGRADSPFQWVELICPIRQLKLRDRIAARQFRLLQHGLGLGLTVGGEDQGCRECHGRQEPEQIPQETSWMRVA